MSTNVIHPKIVSRNEWIAARKELLAKEKALTRQRDVLTAEVRALPWVEVEKEYVFDDTFGKVTLAELFDGRSQLFIKHFMMGPGAAHQCVGCSLEVDHIEGILDHLQNHDVSYVVVARAPIEEIQAVRKRMGGVFGGFRRITAISITISTSLFGQRRLLPAALSTTSNKHPHGLPELKTSLVTAFSTRTRRAGSSTHTRPMVAAENSFWAFIAISM
jgi:uncharacterized protein DUF899